LTGWDIDILTPPEFQAGVQRLDQTLKSIEGITQEMIDKVIALGLIDVRDIEEVGTGPLMEELGLDEETAQKVVDRCAEEAKIVAVEQEEKKRAEAAEKAAVSAALGGALNPTGEPDSRGVDAVAFANPLLPQTPAAEVAGEGAGAGEAAGAGEGEEAADSGETPGGEMPGAMEATEGIAPEIATHKVEPLASSDELSPEERAIQAPGGDQQLVPDGDQARKEYADEDADTAALAEGRAEPPANTRNEP
jgi:hypothetical protein